MQLRRGQDPIHDTRVAIRRLRSTTRVFGKLLDKAAAGHLDEELKWFAGLLGEVRDRQVQRRRFRKVLADWPPELVLGPVANRINTDLHSEQLRARNGGGRRDGLSRGISTCSRPCSDGVAGCLSPRSPPSRRSQKRASRAERKADKRLAAAVESGDDDLLHRARKAAKRARYAAELRRPLDDSGAAKKAEKHYKRIQRVLGEHQDSVVASDALAPLRADGGNQPWRERFHLRAAVRTRTADCRGRTESGARAVR